MKKLVRIYSAQRLCLNASNDQLQKFTHQSNQLIVVMCGFVKSDLQGCR